MVAVTPLEWLPWWGWLLAATTALTATTALLSYLAALSGNKTAASAVGGFLGAVIVTLAVVWGAWDGMSECYERGFDGVEHRGERVYRNVTADDGSTHAIYEGHEHFCVEGDRVTGAWVE